MELIIINSDEDWSLRSIDFNHKEIKQDLALKLEKYKGLVYSDEEIKLAKADRATLNKFKEAIETKRKEIKGQCLRPYDEFEVKIKEILALVDKPILEIDSQVKSFENKQREDKKKTIIGILDENIGSLKEILSLDKLWNDKWLNVTYRISTITEEIVASVERVGSDLKVIESLKSEFELQIKDRYLDKLNLSEAITLKAKLEERKVRLEKLENYKEQQVPEDRGMGHSHYIPNTPPIDPTITLILKIEVTTKQKNVLMSYLMNNKIPYSLKNN